MKVAETILATLGGRKFMAMTGAKNFIGSDTMLMFALPKGAKDGINKCRVTLTPEDLYDVEFFTIKGGKVIDRGSVSGVYGEDLRGVFESRTGLLTSL